MNITTINYASLISAALFTLAACNGETANPTISKPAMNDGTPMDIPVIARPITLDGNIAVGEWEDALYMTDFKENNAVLVKQGAVPLKTEAWIGRTETDLCVAFRCSHDRPAEIVTEATQHDGALWNDDSVEIFLDPQGNRENYYQLIINAGGVLFDQQCRIVSGRNEVDWDSGASAAAQMFPDGFSIEARVPLSAFNLGLNKTGIINLNLGRNTVYLNSNLSLFGNYHKPADWQAFALPYAGNEKYPLAMEKIEWSRFAGDNEIVAQLQNLTIKDVTVTGRVEIAQGRNLHAEDVKVHVAKSACVDFPLRYSVQEGTNAAVKLILFDTQGREIVSAYRLFQPYAVVSSVSFDSDVLIVGEPMNLTVILNVNETVTADYTFVFTVFDAQGNEIARREAASTGKSTSITIDEIAKVPLESGEAEIECMVKNLKNGKEVYRVKIPVQLVRSLWN